VAQLCGSCLTEGVEEPVQRRGVAPGCGPHQPAGVVVDDHAQVAVSLAVRDLVDPDPSQTVQLVGAPGQIRDDPTQMPVTVRQLIRSSSATVEAAVCAASHAQVSSNPVVQRAPGRAQGTAPTTTPCSGQVTRGASASRCAGTVPTSNVRHRRRPWPRS